MNAAFSTGVLRHLIQVGAGAAGMGAIASGNGLELAVAAAVSVANLVWFFIQNRAKA